MGIVIDGNNGERTAHRKSFDEENVVRHGEGIPDGVEENPADAVRRITDKNCRFGHEGEFGVGIFSSSSFVALTAPNSKMVNPRQDHGRTSKADINPGSNGWTFDFESSQSCSDPKDPLAVGPR